MIVCHEYKALSGVVWVSTIRRKGRGAAGAGGPRWLSCRPSPSSRLTWPSAYLSSSTCVSSPPEGANDFVSWGRRNPEARLSQEDSSEGRSSWSSQPADTGLRSPGGMIDFAMSGPKYTRQFSTTGKKKKLCKENCSAKLHVNTTINSKLETLLHWRSARLWRRRPFDLHQPGGDWPARCWGAGPGRSAPPTSRGGL